MSPGPESCASMVSLPTSLTPSTPISIGTSSRSNFPRGYQEKTENALCSGYKFTDSPKERGGAGEEVREGRKWCAINNSPFHKGIHWLRLPTSMFKPCQNYHRHVTPQQPLSHCSTGGTVTCMMIWGHKPLTSQRSRIF